MKPDGMSIPRLLRLYPDDETAEAWFAQARWKSGVECPHCRSHRIKIGPAHPTMPYRCRDCNKYFSVKINSVMQSSKLGYRAWAIAICLLSQNPKGISSIQLAKVLDITQEAAWFLGHRIREAWSNRAFFSGEVEVDEAYFGGKEKNKHAKKKLRLGRGTAGKTPVAAARSRQTNRISAEVLPDTKADSCQGFVCARTPPRASVYTDTAAVYEDLPRRHLAVNHGRGEYVRGEVHVNGCESFWALLKRGYLGTHHWMSPKHLQRYVDEFAGRHNIRKLGVLERMESVVRGMCGKRLTYRMLVGI